MRDCEPITECIACGSKRLSPVLDLGMQPLANEYVDDKMEIQQEFPLAINRCEECFHVQLTHQVNPELMFKNYAYVSGVSQTAKEWFDWTVDFAKSRYVGNINSVLDIGCNDGSLLDSWKKYNTVTTYGVDPAENLYHISSKNHNVHCGFFTGKEFGNSTFDIITVLNAFAHNSNQLELLKNIKNRMHDNSVLICSTSQADMILNGEFDTIYHEHVSFYNIKSADALCKRAGLNLVDVVKHPIHGTSYIFVISKKSDNSENVQKLILDEEIKGLYNKETYEIYAENAYKAAESFANRIRKYRDQGYTIIGYTAPAKGNTLMNFAKEGPDFIFEDTPTKQNKFTPGLHIPIYETDFKNLNQDKIVWVPLAWNVYEEIHNKIVKNRPNDEFMRVYE